MHQVILIGENGYIGKEIKIALSKNFIVNGYNKNNIENLFINNDYSKHSLIHLGQPSNNNYVFNHKDLELVERLNKLNFGFSLYLSSINVLNKEKKNNDDNNLNNSFINDYCKLKLLSENKFNPNKTTILRLGHVYGKIPKKGTILADIFKQINNAELKIHNIESKIYFLWMGDLINLITKILLKQISGKFNVYNETNINVGQILTYLKNKKYLSNQTKIINLKKNNILYNVNPLVKSTKLIFNWKPKVSIFEYIDNVMTNE